MNPETPQTPPAAEPTPTPSEPTPSNTPVPPLTPTQDQPTMAGPVKPLGGRKKKLAILAVIAGVLVVLGGAGAAAYFGVIVPNKPENKLAAAFVDLADQDQMTISGRVDYLDKKATGDIKGTAIDYTAKVNLKDTQLDLSGKFGVNGAEVTYDTRFIDQDIYARASGLNGLAPLIPVEDPSLTPIYSSMLSSLNDQWYVVDRSFLQQSGPAATCIADLSFAFTKEDVDKIEAAYKKYPLFSVKSSSSEKVDGVNTTKFELDPASDETAKNFAHELESLSVVEKVKKCTDASGASDELGDELDDATNNETNDTVTAWITNDNKLKKLEITGDDDQSNTKLTANFNFDDVKIEKPDGAKPIQDIINQLYGGGFSTDDSNTLVQ